MVDRTTGKSYVQIYAEILRLAVEHLSDVQLRVLLYIASYSGETGLAYPGYDAIARAVGIRKETAVQVVDELVACGWVGYARRGELDPLTRRQLSNVYQLSLDLIAINPDKVAEAREIAEYAFHKTLLSMYEFPNQAKSGLIYTDRESPQGHQNQTPHGKHRKSTSAKAPHVPDEEGGQIDNRDYDSALASEAEEALAQRLYTATADKTGRASTTIAAARRLVARRGQLVESALERLSALRAKKPDYEIRDPMAMVTAWCSPKANKRQDDGGGSRYVTGEYADFINH